MLLCTFDKSFHYFLLTFFWEWLNIGRFAKRINYPNYDIRLPQLFQEIRLYNYCHQELLFYASAAIHMVGLPSLCFCIIPKKYTGRFSANIHEDLWHLTMCLPIVFVATLK